MPENTFKPYSPTMFRQIKNPFFADVDVENIVTSVVAQDSEAEVNTGISVSFTSF